MLTRPPAPHRWLAFCAVLALPFAACNRNSDTCHGGGKSSVKRLHDCVRLCEQEGDDRACDKLTRIEPELHQDCMIRANLEACRALCEGRHDDPGACKRLSDLAADK